MEQSEEKELTPYERKIQALARGREKMMENRKVKSELRQKEKIMAIEEKQKKLEERKQKVAEFEASKYPPEPKQEEKPKKKKIVAEVSESDSEDEDTESDSDESVEVIVKRKPKKVIAKLTKKKATPKAKPIQTQPTHNVSQLTAEVAKQLLKQKLIDDNYASAMRSLFPTHNF